MIRRWIYSLIVCWKYRIIPLPFRIGNKASHITMYFENSPREFRFIWMSPLNSNFLSVFMHEVGHSIYRKRGYKNKIIANEDKFSLRNDGVKFFRVLYEESFATRFSRKSLRGKFEYSIMLKYFHTYTGACFYHIPKFNLQHEQESLIGFVRKMEKRITQ